MTKSRKSILSTILCAIMLLISICALAACGSKDLSVTFNIDGKTQQVEVVDGKVSQMPADPTKEYYSFRGWYTTSTFDEGTEFTGDTEVKESITVYAYFAPIKIDISVNGENATTINRADLDTKTASFKTEALEKDLTFDGWYIDAGYTTTYSDQDADTLYAHFVAEVVYDNGYEILYSEKVQENSVIGTSPLERNIEGFVKDYMSSDDIYFVDSENPVTINSDGSIDFNDIDFTKPVTKNTTITVQWRTPYLGTQKGVWSTNTVSGNVCLNNLDSWCAEVTAWAKDNNAIAGTYWQQFPVISFGSRVTVKATDETAQDEIKRVDSVYFKSFNFEASFTNAKVIIFQEGIQSIQGVQGGETAVQEEFSLPSTLKVIDDSFNYFPKLKSLQLPDGVEVIINSFWSNAYTIFTTTEWKKGYDFTINIPSSIVSLSSVPNNLQFAENSPFYIGSDGGVYKNDNGKTLLITGVFDEKTGSITVADGVKGIQVGAFNDRTADKLLKKVYLPSSWEYVGYNALKDNYDCYFLSNKGSSSFDKLWHEGYSEAQILRLNGEAYSITSSLSSVVFLLDCTEWPESIPAYSIAASKKAWNDATSKYPTNVQLVGEKASGSVTIYATINDIMLGTSSSVEAEATAGEQFTESYLKEKLGLGASTIVVESITENGETLTFGGVVNRNYYLAASFNYNVNGCAYTAESDHVVITGFDVSTTAAILGSGDVYLINIPDEVGGLPVTEIAANAFSGDDAAKIGAVFIGKNVEKIGASAFENCTNLNKIVIYSRKLKRVEDKAFMNTAITSLSLPLTTMEYIGSYAFKIKTLAEFNSVAEETNEAVQLNDKTAETAVVGRYYFVRPDSYTPSKPIPYTQIVKYVSATTAYSGTASDPTNKTVAVPVLDVQLVATAGGAKSGDINLGLSLRTYSVGAVNQIFRYEVMTGSVYYRQSSKFSSAKGIVFGAVSKVHENAFTDMNEKYSTQTTTKAGVVQTKYVRYYEMSNTDPKIDLYDSWISVEELNAIANKTYDFAATGAIFEDGWWEGIKSTSDDYETKMAFMKTIIKSSAYLSA